MEFQKIVFCLYAEYAGLFGKQAMFHDYLEDYLKEELENIKQISAVYT